MKEPGTRQPRTAGDLTQRTGEATITSVSLLTNNPDKIEQLKADRISVVGRIPIVIPANTHDEGYLEVKRRKTGHILERPHGHSR